MIKRMNKKGQDPTPIGTIIGFVLIAVVAILVLWYFSSGAQTIVDNAKIAQSEITILSSACSADLGTTDNYCLQAREINYQSTKITLNCQYAVEQGIISWAGDKVSCVKSSGVWAKEQCSEMEKYGTKDYEKKWVNGKLCSDWMPNINSDMGIKENGNSCANKGECKSGHCVNKVCVECEINSDCVTTVESAGVQVCKQDTHSCTSQILT